MEPRDRDPGKPHDADPRFYTINIMEEKPSASDKNGEKGTELNSVQRPGFKQVAVYIDSECSRTAINDKQLFQYLKKDFVPYKVANGQRVIGTESGLFEGYAELEETSGSREWEVIQLDRAVHLPATPNLISTFDLARAGISFHPMEGHLVFPSGRKLKVDQSDGRHNKVIMQAPVPNPDHQAYSTIDEHEVEPEFICEAVEESEEVDPKLHRRSCHLLGHDCACIICVKGKLAAKRVGSCGREESEKMNDKVFLDYCGDVEPSTTLKKGMFVATDEHTSTPLVLPVASRTEAHRMLDFWTLKFGKPELVQVDGAKELVAGKFAQRAAELGIELKQAPPYVHNRQGKVERLIRALCCGIRCALSDGCSEVTYEGFWPFAAHYVCYIIDRIAPKGKKSPFEKRTGTPPTLKNLRQFGCRAIINVPKERRSKTMKMRPDGVNKEGVFVGICPSGSAFMVLVDGKIITSPQVKFLEDLDHKRVYPPTFDFYETEFAPMTDDPSFPPEHASQMEALDQDTAECTNEARSPPKTPGEAKIPLHVTSADAVYGNHIPQEGLIAATVWQLGGTKEIEARIQQQIEEVANSLNEEQHNLSPSTIKAMAETIVCEESLDGEGLLTSGKGKEWDEAFTKEVKMHIEQKVLREATPDERKRLMGIPGKILYITKRCGRKKARFVVLGFLSKSTASRFAPVASIASIRTILALRPYFPKWEFAFGDVVSAYLLAPYPEEQLIQLSPELAKVFGFKYGMAQKCLNGLPLGSRAWINYRNEKIKACGWKQLVYDSEVWTRGGDILITYVDDYLVLGPTAKSSLDELSKIFPIKIGKAQRNTEINAWEFDFLNIAIAWFDSGEVSLDQIEYCRKLRDRFIPQQDKRSKVPTKARVKCTEANPDLLHLKQEMCGALQYAATQTRADIDYATNHLSCSKPNDETINKLKEVISYLRNPKKLYYRRWSEGPRISGYSDADFAGSSDAKSQSASLIFLGGNLIFWRSRRQEVVALHSTESEIIAMSGTARVILAHKNFLQELMIGIGESPTVETNLDSIVLRSDSQSAITIAMSEAGLANRIRHMKVRSLLVRELSASGAINIRKIPASSNSSDALTKPLGPQSFEVFLGSIDMS